MNEPAPDVGLCFATTPPLVVPLSHRAKERLMLPEGVDCALFLEDPEKVLSLFGTGWVFTTLKEYEPTMIIPLSIQKLDS